MNILRFLSLALLISGLLIGPATIDAQEQSVASDDAQRLLQNYFYDLQYGNTADILNLITGPMLQRRGHLLKNDSQYGAFLQKRYENANFSILPPAFIHNNKLSLKASIDFDGRDKMELIYSFEKDRKDSTLKIYSEEVIQ